MSMIFFFGKYFAQQDRLLETGLLPEREQFLGVWNLEWVQPHVGQRAEQQPHACRLDSYNHT